MDDKLRSSSHKSTKKKALKCTTLTLAKQVQADLLTIIRMTRNAWAQLETVERDAQFQQSGQVKWYYHNGVATVRDQVWLPDHDRISLTWLSLWMLQEPKLLPKSPHRQNTESNVIIQLLLIWHNHAVITHWLMFNYMSDLFHRLL